MLEKEAVSAVTHAVKTRGRKDGSSSLPTGDRAFALMFVQKDATDVTGEAQVEVEAASGHVFELPTLLSPETLSALRSELAQKAADMIYIPKSSEACHVQLALSRLQAFKESNEIQKELPQVQNPVGTRAARQRLAELGGRSDEQDEADNSV